MPLFLRRLLFLLLAVLLTVGGFARPAAAQPAPAPSTQNAAFAADVVRQSLFPVLIEGESTLLEVELRNSGTETWREGDVQLVNLKNPYGGKDAFPLQQDITPGESMVFAWRTQEFKTPGLYTTEWQLRGAGGEDIDGGFLRFTVVVLPKALAEKRDELQQQIKEWTDQQVDNIEAMITAWIKQQVENAANDARSRFCGSPLIPVLAVLLLLGRKILHR